MGKIVCFHCHAHIHTQTFDFKMNWLWPIMRMLCVRQSEPEVKAYAQPNFLAFEAKLSSFEVLEVCVSSSFSLSLCVTASIQTARRRRTTSEDEEEEAKSSFGWQLENDRKRTSRFHFCTRIVVKFAVPNWEEAKKRERQGNVTKRKSRLWLEPELGRGTSRLDVSSGKKKVYECVLDSPTFSQMTSWSSSSSLSDIICDLTKLFDLKPLSALKQSVRMPIESLDHFRSTRTLNRHSIQCQLLPQSWASISRSFFARLWHGLLLKELIFKLFFVTCIRFFSWFSFYLRLNFCPLDFLNKSWAVQTSLKRV